MSFYKKASLAVSVLALSTAANAELVAMDEAALSAATGQAGIDIDIELGNSTSEISVGSVTWTDTDTGGGVAISTVNVGSASGSNLTLTNTIDVTADGELVIGSGAVDDLYVGIGSVGTFADSASTNDLSTNLASDINLYLDVDASTITISDSAAGAGETQIVVSGGAVEVTSDGSNNSSADLFAGDAVTLDEIKVYGAGGEGTGLSTDATLTFNSAGLTISDVNLQGTIEVGSVGLGGASIGSLAVSNIVVSPSTSITISGHN